MNRMQRNIEAAVRATFDPDLRRKQIDRLGKHLQFSRMTLFFIGAVALLEIIVSLFGDRSHTGGTFLAVAAVLLAAHVGMSMRLVQLKVEEERDKRAESTASNDE